jgi:hypothetical protein
MDSLAGDVQSQATLHFISLHYLRLESVKLTIVAPIPTINMLMIVKQIFRGEENHLPQLMCNQYTPGRP